MTFRKKDFTEIYHSMTADLQQRSSALSDVRQGSVIASLLASLAARQATFYQQLQVVYQSAFIDSASGVNLEQLVALLGASRRAAEHVTGTVTFVRQAGSTAQLSIAVGTRLLTQETAGESPQSKAYLTTEAVTLAVGTDTVACKVQAEQAGKHMTTAANTVVVMAQPVAGVSAVSNAQRFDFLGREQESDEQLRARSKQILLAAGKASASAIERSLLEQPGVRDVRVFTMSGENAKNAGVRVVVDGLTRDNGPQLQARVDAVRAAGVHVSLEQAKRLTVDACFRLRLVDANLAAEERRRLEADLVDVLRSLIVRSRMGASLTVARFTASLLQQDKIDDLEGFALDVKDGAQQSLANSDSMNVRKKLEANPEQRFVPGLIRVATEKKVLKIACRVAVNAPNENARLAIIDRINKKIQQLKLTEQQLQEVIGEGNFDAMNLSQVRGTVNNVFDKLTAMNTQQQTSLSADLVGDKRSLMKVTLQAALDETADDTAFSLTDLQTTLRNSFIQASGDDANRLHHLTLAVKEFIALMRTQAIELIAVDQLKRLLLQAAIEAHGQALQRLVKDEASTSQQVAQLHVQLSDLKQSEKPAAEKQLQIAQWQQQITKKQELLLAYPAQRLQLQGKLQTIQAKTETIVAAWSQLVQGQLQSLDGQSELQDYCQGFGSMDNVELRNHQLKGQTFDGHVITDQLPSGLIDKATVEELWLYDQTLYLNGRMTLDLPLNLSQAEKEMLQQELRAAITRYLEARRAEENIDTNAIIEIARSHALVRRVDAARADFHLRLAHLPQRLVLANKEGVLALERRQKVTLFPEFELRS